MADVTLLWFACSNPECNYIPIKTKKEKVKRYWMHGKSTKESARPRLFMRYIEGHYQWMDNGNTLIFNCKYGKIIMYDEYDKQDVNGFVSPIKGQMMCDVCKERIKNEGALFQ